MVSLLNSTCAKFDGVVRSGARIDLEDGLLYVKGTWLPSEFSISICDGNDAWTGKASETFVVANASRLGLTESEYVDKVEFYLSQQQPNVSYELKWGKGLSPELICSLPQQQPILQLQTTTDSGTRVAAEMVQLLLDAHRGLSQELARKARGFEREIAARERSLTSLQKQLAQGSPPPIGGTNGHVNKEKSAAKTGAGTSSRSKRKAGASNAETGSKKRNTNPAESLPLYQEPPSPGPLLVEQTPTTRPPPLSTLGYKQQSRAEVGRETSKDPSWLDAVETGAPNGLADDSLSEGQDGGAKRAFLARLSDVAEPQADPPPAKKGSKKKHSKSGGKRSSRKTPQQRSAEDSLDQVEDVVEKGIECVDNIFPSQDPPEVSSPLKSQRKSPASGKKQPRDKKDKKDKKQVTPRSHKKKSSPVLVEVDEDSEPESEPSEIRGIAPIPGPAADEDREIDVQNAEFNDFDASRSANSFAEGQFWALYDDQDGMPRFYGYVTSVENVPFQVSVEWLEPFKANTPSNGLVKTAKLSPSCGEFTFGAECVQDLPAFSHVVSVDRDPRRSVISFWPRKDEIWALYRYWDKKQAKKEDGDKEFYYEYDVVKVTSEYSSAEGLAVVPLIKVEGFKSLFTVADDVETYHIPQKQIQSRFSHNIPQHLMIGSESPGVPRGAWELDPASTPSEYLDMNVLEVPENAK